MTEAPLYFAPLPRTTVPSSRLKVVAPTVMTHGLLCAVVELPGPELPAEAATKTPALAAL